MSRLCPIREKYGVPVPVHVRRHAYGAGNGIDLAQLKASMNLLQLLPGLLAASLLGAATLPEYAEALRREGAGDKAGAIARLEAVLKNDPAFARGYYRLVEFDPAAAGDIRPRMPSLYACLGRVELARVRKQYDAGQAEAQACSRRLPESVSLYDRWLTLAREAKLVKQMAPEMAKQADGHPASAARQYAKMPICVRAGLRWPRREPLRYRKPGDRYLERAGKLAPEINEIDDALYILECGSPRDSRLAEDAASPLS